MTRIQTTVLVLITATWLGGCKKDDPEPCADAGLPEINANATPYDLNIPPFFPPLPVPENNPLTEEGVALGRHLFWEKKLSGDNSMSCGTCHIPEFAFAEETAFATGITGDVGNRNTMPLINIGYATSFFWDGRSETLEEQVGDPIVNPIEMHEQWNVALEELADDPIYPTMFDAAFGSTDVTEDRVRRAMSSFMRIMLSGGSKFDLERIGAYDYTDSEQRGYDLFLTEGGEPGGADCFHCHGFGSGQFTDFSFRNNGLDSIFDDPGRMLVTGLASDEGKFKVPTLRNVAFSAPFMHDGRFETLEEVIEHYNSGVVESETLDPFMKFEEGLNLTAQDKEDLLNFLLCLSDQDFLNNEAFSDPHE